MEWKIWNETNHSIHDLISRLKSNLEALPETIRKTHDLKKLSLGNVHSGILELSETSIERPLHNINDNINVEYYIMYLPAPVLFRSPSLFKPFTYKFDRPMI